uniref:(northern house mosquito) hypothetical protein n=1 Tax=Culex pipiens TaxID=7175 RepID=A0A8D8J9I6_CULPI
MRTPRRRFKQGSRKATEGWRLSPLILRYGKRRVVHASGGRLLPSLWIRHRSSQLGLPCCRWGKSGQPLVIARLTSRGRYWGSQQITRCFRFGPSIRIKRRLQRPLSRCGRHGRRARRTIVKNSANCSFLEIRRQIH